MTGSEQLQKGFDELKAQMDEEVGIITIIESEQGGKLYHELLSILLGRKVAAQKALNAADPTDHLAMVQAQARFLEAEDVSGSLGRLQAEYKEKMDKLEEMRLLLQQHKERVPPQEEQLKAPEGFQLGE